MKGATWEFTMVEKRKPTSPARLRSVATILADLESPERSRRQRAIDEFRGFAPHVEVFLTVLLRGLNDPDELVRVQAGKALLRAFPSAEAPLSDLLPDIESDEPKVRLAAISRVLILLPNVLAALSGTQFAPVTEDLMEHAGRWVAWTRDRQRVLAVADSFADVMQQAIAAGEPDPYVKKAPGVSPAARKTVAVLEDESLNIIDDVKKVFRDPDTWLDSPNNSLGGEKPRDLISTEREREVRDLLRRIQDGITT
jgi:hypothetical protein